MTKAPSSGSARRRSLKARWLRRLLLITAAVVPVGVVGGALAGSLISERIGGSDLRGVPLSPLEQLEAFQRPVRPADVALRRQPAVQAAVAQLTEGDGAAPEEFRAGAARDDLRVLLAGLGDARRAIYAFTTVKDRVCVGLTEFTSGCYEGLPLGAAVDVTVGDPDVEGAGEPPLVWGLTRNDVDRVDVEVEGRAQPATVARNAYFFRLSGNLLPASAITALVVHRADGTKQRIPLP